MRWGAEPDVVPVVQWLADRTGLRLEGDPARNAAGVVREAMRRSGARDPDRFLTLLRGGGPELDALMSELTVGETYFFRDPAQWSELRDRVLPELRALRGPSRTLRAWSAACASGEEAYTLAMVLREMRPPGPFFVVGTDLSRERLAVAERGEYGGWSLRDVPGAVVQRYFTPEGSRFRLVPEVRRAVSFRFGNLADPASCLPGDRGAYDLILCRNVLIYLDAESVARAARLLMDRLAEGGWLFLGASDPPISAHVPAETHITPVGLAYRKANGQPLRPAPPAPRPTSSTLSAPRCRPQRPAIRPAGASARAHAPEAAPAEVAEVSAEVEKLYRRREYEACARRAAELLERRPEEESAWVWRVRALANRGELTAAMEACERALAHHRTAAELNYLFGVLLLQAGLAAAAVAALRQTLYLDPELAAAHAMLGTALFQTADAAGAERALGAAERLLARLDPQDEVPASDGELAGHLLRGIRVQLEILASRRSA